MSLKVYDLDDSTRVSYFRHFGGMERMAYKRRLAKQDSIGSGVESFSGIVSYVLYACKERFIMQTISSSIHRISHCTSPIPLLLLILIHSIGVSHTLFQQSPPLATLLTYKSHQKASYPQNNSPKPH